MNLLSILIINLCTLDSDPKCVEKLHVCVRDTFEINFFDELTEAQEAILPYQIKYCDIERQLSYE